MILPNTLPFPAAPQPSKMTITGSPASFIFIWAAKSFALASSNLCVNSSSSGLDALTKSFSIRNLLNPGNLALLRVPDCLATHRSFAARIAKFFLTL